VYRHLDLGIKGLLKWDLVVDIQVLKVEGHIWDKMRDHQDLTAWVCLLYLDRHLICLLIYDMGCLRKDYHLPEFHLKVHLLVCLLTRLVEVILNLTLIQLFSQTLLSLLLVDFLLQLLLLTQTIIIRPNHIVNHHWKGMSLHLN